MAVSVEHLKTIPERVFQQLREAIIEGTIPAGTKISEAELAQTYGISRGPLREAISQLAAMGLVERRANVGARVIQMSSDHLLDIFRVREALEGMAARLAAAKMTPEQVQTLMETLDEHGETINEDAGNNYFQESGDLDFHYQVVMGSCSDHLIKLLCNDLYYLVRLYRCQFGMRSKRGPNAIVEHRNIAEAIARGDGEMAELLMRSHIRASRENVERLLTQQN